MRAKAKPFHVVAFVIGLIVYISASLSWQETRRFDEWDAPVYLTIAYDLKRFATFSNGRFDPAIRANEVPKSGMFVGPLYPSLLWLLLETDNRLFAAAACAVNAIQGRDQITNCDRYRTPLIVAHTILIVLGIVAIGLTAQIVLEEKNVFCFATAIAAVGVTGFSVFLASIAIESLLFFLFSYFMFFFMRAFAERQLASYAFAGLAGGLCTLAKASFLVLLPLGAAWFLFNAIKWRSRPLPLLGVVVYIAAFLALVFLWVTRNYVSVGKLGLSEEYGAAALVERFQYNRMTWKEATLSVPYCVPQIGRSITRVIGGPQSMERFNADIEHGFHRQGIAERARLNAAYGKLDPIIQPIAISELRMHWWRHILTTFALAWCGLWLPGIWALICLPIFLIVLTKSLRHDGPSLLWPYANISLVLVIVHAAVMSGSSRYNIGLIGPISVAVAYAASKFYRVRISPFTRRWGGS
jgi:hypothetical protein